MKAPLVHFAEGGAVKDERTDRYWERLGDASYNPSAEDVRVEIPMGAGQSHTKGVSMGRIFDAWRCLKWMHKSCGLEWRWIYGR